MRLSRSTRNDIEPLRGLGAPRIFGLPDACSLSAVAIPDRRSLDLCTSVEVPSAHPGKHSESGVRAPPDNPPRAFTGAGFPRTNPVPWKGQRRGWGRTALSARYSDAGVDPLASQPDNQRSSTCPIPAKRSLHAPSQRIGSERVSYLPKICRPVNDTNIIGLGWRPAAVLLAALVVGCAQLSAVHRFSIAASSKRRKAHPDEASCR